MKMGRVKRLAEDSFDGTAYIKLCGTSFPYDGEYCASDECPVLNEIAEKLARYERLEEQAAELVTGFLEKGIQMTQKALEKVAGGAVDLVFKEVERGEKDE